MKKCISIILFGFGLSFFGISVHAEVIQAENKDDTLLGPLSEVNTDEFNLSMAKQLLEKQKWTEALGILRPLIKREPRSIPVIVGMATALTYTGNRKEALSVLKQGTSDLKKSNRGFLVRRIRVLSRLFLTNKTFQTYQDGLNLIMGKKYRSAKEKFERALVEEPDNVEILTRLGQSLLMDNDPAQASEKLRLATQLNPFQPEVRLWLGRALFQHNKSNDAVRELTAAYNEMKGSEIVSVWLSEALAAAGQSNQAIRILDNDLKQWPIHVLSLISVARLRTQGAHVDSSVLWAARKDLQLAASRLDQYSQGDLSRYSGDLDIDLNRSAAEVKGEIQRLLQQVENRLSQLTNQR